MRTREFYKKRIVSEIESLRTLFIRYQRRTRGILKPTHYVKKFCKDIDRCFIRIKKYERRLRGCELRTLKKYFRETMRKFIFESYYVKRGYLKPSGFVGDFVMLEGMYDNETPAVGFGYLLDSYFLGHDYVAAVRRRKDIIRNILSAYIHVNARNKKKLNILDLACGGCREIRELKTSHLGSSAKVKFVLVDKDKKALDFSKKKLKRISRNFIFSFIERDILEPVKSLKNNTFDLVYSIGLIDYLPDSVICSLIRRSFAMISPGGLLILTHKNVCSFPAPAPDWFCDWRFIPRSRKEIRELVSRSLKKKDFHCRSRYASNGRIFYLTVRKLKRKS